MEFSESIPAQLRLWSEKHPDQEAFVFVGDGGRRCSLTSEQIYRLSRDFGRHLLKLGVKKGDKVCSLIPDSPQGIVAFFGILSIGGVIQTGIIQINDGRFLKQNLNKSECRVLILSSDPANKANKIFTPCFTSIVGNRCTSAELPHVKNVIFAKTGGDLEEVGFDWENELTDDDPDVTDVSISVGDDAVISATSGTTGMSKLILHGNKMFFVRGLYNTVAESIEATTRRQITFFEPHPLTWLFGLPYWYIQTGHRMVLMDRRFPPQDEKSSLCLTKNTIVNEHCQLGKLSPSDCHSLADMVKGLKPGEWPLEAVFLGGQPIRESIRKIVPTVAQLLFNIYGSSETLLISAKPIREGTEMVDFDTGSVADFVEVKIVDEKLEPVAPGEFGQILVRSPLMFKSYMGDEEATRSSLTPDGFFYTNDYGSLTAEGDLIVQGRYGDVINRGQHCFHPSWIESIVKQCPRVTDVAVVKVPDERFFTEICACFIPESGCDLDEDTVKSYCRERFMSSDSTEKTACPRYYLKMESFPVNANGKIVRSELERKAAELLKLV